MCLGGCTADGLVLTSWLCVAVDRWEEMHSHACKSLLDIRVDAYADHCRKKAEGADGSD